MTTMMPKLKLTSLIMGCLLATAQAQQRKEVVTVRNFDINKYMSAKWFTHQQVETVYVPDIQNYCVAAEYNILERPTFLGYTVSMHMYTQFSSGKAKTQELCAHYSDPDTPSKLSVAPCFLPKFAAGSYWVLAYDEPEGYALVSGGPPTNKKAGLWVLSRSPQRDEALILKARAIAKDAGYDVSALNDVNHDNCNYASPVNACSASDDEEGECEAAE